MFAGYVLGYCERSLPAGPEPLPLETGATANAIHHTEGLFTIPRMAVAAWARGRMGRRRLSQVVMAYV